MSKWVNSYTSSEARRWLEISLLTNRDAEMLRGDVTSPRGTELWCAQSRAPSSPLWLSVFLGIHRRRLPAHYREAGTSAVACHGRKELQTRRGAGVLPTLRQAPTPLSAQIASPWMIMECKHGDSLLGVEENIGRRVDGERTVQAAKFNLREFGSVLSISNTLKKNRIPRTKEKGKVGETFHPVQSMESKSIILCSLPGPSNASKNTKDPGPWAAGHPQGGGGERDKDQDKKQPPRLSTAQAVFHRPKKSLQVRNMSMTFGHLILTKTLWSRCYWNSYFTNKKQNENDEMTDSISNNWKSGWNLNPGPLSPIGQT